MGHQGHQSRTQEHRSSDRDRRSNDKANEVVDKYTNDYRIVAIGKKKDKIDETLSKIDIIGFALLEDIIRNNAKETLKFFKDNNVDVKIISGDNSRTVTTIAHKLNLKGVLVFELWLFK